MSWWDIDQVPASLDWVAAIFRLSLVWVPTVTLQGPGES
jgi:hypothetical protein